MHPAIAHTRAPVGQVQVPAEHTDAGWNPGKNTVGEHDVPHAPQLLTSALVLVQIVGAPEGN